MKLRAILYALIISVLPVSAQSVCAARTDMVKLFTEKYKEQRVGFGVTSRPMIELFVSEKGSFSIITSYPNGISCLLTTGSDWQTEVLKKGTGL